MSTNETPSEEVDQIVEATAESVEAAAYLPDSIGATVLEDITSWNTFANEQPTDKEVQYKYSTIRDIGRRLLSLVDSTDRQVVLSTEQKIHVSSQMMAIMSAERTGILMSAPLARAQRGQQIESLATWLMTLCARKQALAGAKRIDNQ